MRLEAAHRYRRDATPAARLPPRPAACAPATNDDRRGTVCPRPVQVANIQTSPCQPPPLPPPTPSSSRTPPSLRTPILQPVRYILCTACGILYTALFHRPARRASGLQRCSATRPPGLSLARERRCWIRPSSRCPTSAAASCCAKGRAGRRAPCGLRGVHSSSAHSPSTKGSWA